MFGLNQLHIGGLIVALLLGILAGSAFQMRTGPKSAQASELLTHPYDLARKLRKHNLGLGRVSEN
jgi:hypothetical protein